MRTMQAVVDDDKGWFWVGGLHQWLVEAGVGTEAAWWGHCCSPAASLLLLPWACLRRPRPCCRRAPPPCGSATARRTGGNWPGWCPGTSSSPGSSASSSRLATTSGFPSFIFLPPTRLLSTQQTAKPFSAAGPHLCTRAWEQQWLQRWVVVRDRQPTGRPSSKSTKTYEHKHIRVRTRWNTNT